MSLEQLKILQKAKKENNREILDGFNNEVEKMIDKIINVLDKKPTYVGQAAMFAILIAAYQYNGYGKEILMKEIGDAWENYDKLTYKSEKV